jgi:quercetin dioxygenase-like cupin family protein
MTDYFRSVPAAVGFAAEAPTKADLFAGQHLFVGLNCFEPGQTQRTHTHAGADKFYLVLSGKASMLVGEEIREVGEGTVVWAPADVPHGVTDVSERTVLLVAIGPPPGKVSRSQVR